MTWIIFLTILLIAILIMTLSKENEKLLFSHIKNTYPAEWQKFNITKMGVKPYEVLPEVMGNSIKQGFLSQQHDLKLLKLYKRFKLFKYLSFGVFLIVIFYAGGI
jgi:hypothetical protein